MECGRVAVADGLLPHGGFVDGFEGESYLDEFFVGGVGHWQRFHVVVD